MEKVSRANEFNYLLYSNQPVHQYSIFNLSNTSLLSDSCISI
jgi:hypothetical protein